MSALYDQIALALHVKLIAAGPIEDNECALTHGGVMSCIRGLMNLFVARDQLQRALGGEQEFDADRFVQLATKGEV